MIARPSPGGMGAVQTCNRRHPVGLFVLFLFVTFFFFLSPGKVNGFRKLIATFPVHVSLGNH